MINSLKNIILYLLFPSTIVAFLTKDIFSYEGMIFYALCHILLIVYFYNEYKKNIKKDIKNFKKKHLKTLLY